MNLNVMHDVNFYPCDWAFVKAIFYANNLSSVKFSLYKCLYAYHSEETYAKLPSVKSCCFVQNASSGVKFAFMHKGRLGLKSSL